MSIAYYNRFGQEKETYKQSICQCHHDLNSYVLLTLCFLQFISVSAHLFLFFFLLLFNYSCLHFLPNPAKPTSIPHLHPPPWFCPCVLYSSSWKPLTPLSPPNSPLAIVRLFLTSTSLVIFCLLFSFVLSFQLKVRSYGICPSLPGLFHVA